MRRLFDVEALRDVTADADQQQRQRERPARGADHGARPAPGTAARCRRARRAPPPLREPRSARTGASCAQAARERQRDRRREVHDAGGRDRERRDAPSAPAQRGRVTGRRPGDGPGMPRDDLGRPRRPHALARRDPLEQSRLREIAHAVPQPRVQLGTGLELDPRAPQARHEHRREGRAGAHAFHDAPGAPAVRVERPAPEIGELGAPRVRGDQPDAPGRRERDGLAPGVVVPRGTEPHRATRPTNRGAGSRQRRAPPRPARARARGWSRRGAASRYQRAPPVWRAVNSTNERNNATPTSAGTSSQADCRKQPAIRET